MRNEILYRGFENIPSRQGRGGVYQYVRWQDVADRMNEAFGNLWSSEVMSQDIFGNNIVVRVRVSVFNADTGTFSKQEGFGGAPNDERAEAGNPFKAAYSKALKDACKKWGLGLFLELEDSDEGGHMTPSAPPPGYSGKEYGVPPTQQMSTPPPAAAAPPVVEKPQLAPEARHLAEPTSGGLPTPPSVTMAAPPTDNVVAESVVISQQPPSIPSPQSTQPTTPVPPAPVASAPTPPTPTQPPAPAQGLPTPPQVQLKAEMPMSKMTTISTGEPERISDVQKAALNGILSYKGVNYEELAREAFENAGIPATSIPPADELTYQEAVCVVKFGNDKFRRR